MEIKFLTNGCWVSRLNRSFVALACVASLAACSSAKTKPDADNPTAAADADPKILQARINDLEKNVASLTEKIEEYELKLSSMNDKIPSTSASSSKSSDVAAVVPHPASARGKDIDTTPAMDDPEDGVAADGAIKAYRDGKILFESEKFSDSVLAFSNFLKVHADHPLAGSAQHYIGESYLKLNEPKLAKNEFERVLVSYDRNSHVPDSIARLAEIQDSLGQPNEAAEYRQMLFSLFPQSPAAQAMRKGAGKSVKELDLPAEAKGQKDSESAAPPTAPMPKAGSKEDLLESIPDVVEES